MAVASFVEGSESAVSAAASRFVTLIARLRFRIHRPLRSARVDRNRIERRFRLDHPDSSYRFASDHFALRYSGFACRSAPFARHWSAFPYDFASSVCLPVGYPFRHPHHAVGRLRKKSQPFLSRTPRARIGRRLLCPLCQNSRVTPCEIWTRSSRRSRQGSTPCSAEVAVNKASSNRQ